MRICVITGSRAEYGLLFPLMKALSVDSFFELQIIVTGMHLSHEFGNTYKEIEKDGFYINKKIEILLSSDTSVGIAKTMGLAMISAAECLDDLKPDLVVILGDRYESFAIASVCVVSRIPIAHLHGGEATEGLIDDPFRHSITKMSHLHFCALDEYRNRIIQLGENPETVFTVGALGLDNILNFKLLSKEEIEKKYDFKFLEKNLLVTFHPVTLENSTASFQFTQLLNAIDKLQDTFVIFTKPNSDTDGRVIISLIDDYVKENPRKSIGFQSMGQLNYLSTLQFVDMAVGNSSSGLLEVPSFRKGTVNIGDRQNGRFKPKTVLDCAPSEEEIFNSIQKVYSNEFQTMLSTFVSPLGDGKAAAKIVNFIKNSKINLKKKFHNIL
ncbi:MAG: UDP-N-acetylglucosamine 2-epimerase [Leptospira sp.]|nr:UDP-N-acetylglucosamine 2-epimerase [Leptospira sp.]